MFAKPRTYTETAAHVIQQMLAGTQVKAEVSGQPTALSSSKAWIVTGNDWGGNEGLSVYAEMPALHDIGVNTAGNAIQRVLLQIPEIAKHFDYRINGISGAAIAKHLEQILTPLGIDASKFAQWEGLNDKTGVPNVTACNSTDSTYFGITVVTGDKKAENAVTNVVPTHSVFKDMAHLIEAKHDAIMAGIVKHAGALKDEHGKPVFSQEQLTALGQEKLLIKDNENWGQEISFSIGKLKADETTAKKDPKELNGMDLAGSVLGTLTSKAVENLVLDVVLEVAPQFYPKLVDRERFVSDLKKATEGKVDITELLHCAQLMQEKSYCLNDTSNVLEKAFMDINTGDGATHPNTLKIDLPLPAGEHASKLIADIIRFGEQKGMLKASSASAMTPSEVAKAAQQTPANSVEKPSLFGRIASGLGLGGKAA